MAFPFKIVEHTVPAQHVREWPRATANSQEDVLYIHVKQYIPLDNPDPQPGDVTIIGAHANGFPKELYEALWAELHARTTSSPAFRIRSIWIADVTNQGRSGALNEALLGDDPCWHDHARDLLHLTNVFRDAMPRPLVGVGHSFGGNILTHLSLLHPRLLTTLVLLDPVITHFTFRRMGAGIGPTRSSTFRRETWPSRDAAEASFRRSPFYSSWDPRVLDAWCAHAIRDTPTALFPGDQGEGEGESTSGNESHQEKQKQKQVTLTTTKHQEVFTFFRPLWPYHKADGTIDRDGAPDFDPSLNDKVDRSSPLSFPFYRSEGSSVLQNLPHVRPSVLWVFGGDSDLSQPEGRREKLALCGSGGGGSGGVAAGRVAEVVVEGRGHLFPMEVPALCAEHAAAWIAKEMQRWRDAERAYEEWTRKPFREKTTLSQRFMDSVGRPPVRGGGGGKKNGEAPESKL
ncbi:hypothetical protein SLS62_003466 [Diatrype stigma]|uniref:AB hydrolase-1 domain-containing protein n=1 Tax=Diatrype stigma TaxID=117547 RepID=A0AAN9YRA0_9PEZI